jgi:ligand-binding SRPBCC domain-containing protein
VILLFGFLPVDVHSLRLERILPGRGFFEQSYSWANRQWRHERITTRTEGGCVVTDKVIVQGRLPLVTALLLPVYRLVFRHRHRRLRALYRQPGG